jgi:hypothetical protein
VDERAALDANAPYTRVGRMCGAFLANASDHRVIAVDAVAIRVVVRTAARLSVYRPDSGAVLAWEAGPGGTSVRALELPVVLAPYQIAQSEWQRAGRSDRGK